MTTRTPAELSLMTPEEIKAYKENELKHVFGFDVKFDRHGHPIEQGIGSPGNENVNHFASMKKAESDGLLEPGTYDAALAACWERNRERAIKIGLPKPRNLKKLYEEAPLAVSEPFQRAEPTPPDPAADLRARRLAGLAKGRAAAKAKREAGKEKGADEQSQ